MRTVYTKEEAVRALKNNESVRIVGPLVKEFQKLEERKNGLKLVGLPL